MKTLLYTLLLFATSAHAQQVITDHEWYVAGEDVRLAVELPQSDGAAVAYAELADTHSVAAGTVLTLRQNRGMGIIELPRTMHSGYYRLAVYTRNNGTAVVKNIAVVNTLYRNDHDDITWSATDGATTMAPSSSSTATVIPMLQALESEGHTVVCRVHRNESNSKYKLTDLSATLGVNAKQVHVFDGRFINDSTVVFHTFGISGRQRVVAYASANDGTPLPVEILSPYSASLPTTLPHLDFCYNRSEVEQRSVAMQRVIHNDSVVALSYNDTIGASVPTMSYNLDEYRQFRTVREALLEYVIFVHRGELAGQQRLFVYNEQENYDKWPALVLLDGVPVQDINRLMRYDARRVHHILVYTDKFSFGNNVYKGIVSFVTRTGLMTNFPPEMSAAHSVYEFPK